MVRRCPLILSDYIIDDGEHAEPHARHQLAVSDIFAARSTTDDQERSIPEMMRMLDALQAIDAEDALAPANWHPGEPLLKSPTQNLDDVFAAKGGTDWFLREARKGKRK